METGRDTTAAAPAAAAAAAAPPPSTLQLLVSLPWGRGDSTSSSSRRTRVLPVPVPVSGEEEEEGGISAGALLAPVLREMEAEVGSSRALPPLVATYRAKRCVRAAGFQGIDQSLGGGRATHPTTRDSTRHLTRTHTRRYSLHERLPLATTTTASAAAAGFDTVELSLAGGGLKGGKGGFGAMLRSMVRRACVRAHPRSKQGVRHC